jgi:N-acetylglucosamine kinase
MTLTPSSPLHATIGITDRWNGSPAVGAQSNGRTARVSWGYLLGDEGSGMQSALSGLRAATRSADGRAPPTQLLPLFQKRLDVSSPQGFIEAIYGSVMPRRQIADLAAVVFAAAQARDSTAQEIVAAAAAELVDLVFCLAKRLNLPAQTFPLACPAAFCSISPRWFLVEQPLNTRPLLLRDPGS